MGLTIDQRVRAVISQELGVPEADIASDALLKDQLGADSMDSFSIVAALEVEFGIEIPDHDLAMLRTVRQVSTYVHEKVGTAAGYGHGV
jgi:acyl carrier protein